MRVCGKRSAGNLALADANRRPVKSGNDVYACPSGFKACNEEWLASSIDKEFVTCIPTSLSFDECPITSYALTLDGMDSATAALYSQAAKHEKSSGTLFFSKKVANHPIYEI